MVYLLPILALPIAFIGGIFMPLFFVDPSFPEGSGYISLVFLAVGCVFLSVLKNKAKAKRNKR